MQIKSKFGNYEVVFNNFSSELEKDLKENCFYLIDKNLWHKDFWLIPRKKLILIDASEQSKTYQQIGRYISKLINKGIKRSDKLIIIGGGTIQDIGGFIASILFRGIKWNYYPTTLLSQADSCIGSKTSINIDGFKNQIGTFHPPNKIVIDTEFLKTLPKEEIESGYGEIIKYHLLNNDFSFYQNIDYEIRYCLGVKRKYIEKDEFDKDKRKILNYGHTFGHALESSSNYKLSHGLAILTGISIANFIALKCGYIDLKRYNKLNSLIETRETKIDVNMDDFIYYLKKDKKNISDKLSIIIPYGIKGFKLEEVSYKCIVDLLKEY